MGKRINAHGFQAAGGGNVELINHILNQRQRIAARGNDEYVRQIVRLYRQRRSRPRGLGGLRLTAFLQRAQPRDLRVQALGPRHGRAFGEHGLQQRRELGRAGVLEAKQLHLGDEALHRLVNVRDQLQRQVHRLDLSAEDNRVRPRIDGDIQRIHQRLARRSTRLRARSGRSSTELTALREDGRKRLRHRRRVGKLQRHQLHHHVLRDRHRIQHRDHGRERLEVVRRGRKHEAIATALPRHRVG